MSKKLLIVDDEKQMVKALKFNLEKEGYQIDAVYDGKEAIEKISNYSEHYELIILDLMLPEMDGFEVCRFIRNKLNIPIIMLTAKDEDDDKVMGLELGADDYLTKPFSVRELNARIKSVLRRYEMAVTDGLTGLLNQTMSKQLLKIETDRYIRYNNEVSLILFDIDCFKEVNDIYGHSTGDEVLARIAAETKELFRTSDMVGRYGGDEFTVLLPETGLEQAAQKAEELRQRVERLKFNKEVRIFSVTISLGVASLSTHINEGNDFFSAADEALSYSKKKGKNRVSVFINRNNCYSLSTILNQTITAGSQTP